MHVNDLLKLAVDKGASDLHLKVGSFPMVRVHGRLTRVTEEKRLDHEDLVEMAASIMSATQRQRFKDAQEIDLAYSVPGLGRFRCNVFQQRGTIGMVLRVIPFKVKSIDELGLPPVLKRIAEEERGLVLVTGTTGSGKSTTLAGMIDHINSTRVVARHHHRRPDRVPAQGQRGDHHPARNRRGHAVVRLRPAQRAAPGPGRGAGRRNARHGNHRDGAARRRNRPPGVLDAAHPGRHRNDQPHHLGVPAAPAEADPPAAGGGAEGRDGDAPDSARRRQGPGAGAGGAGRHAVHQGLHHRQGKDAPDSRARSPRARRSTGCRRSTSRSSTCSRRTSSPTTRRSAGLRTSTSSSCEVQGISTTSDQARDQMAGSLFSKPAARPPVRRPRSRASQNSEPPDAYTAALVMLGQRELSEAQVRTRLARRRLRCRRHRPAPWNASNGIAPSTTAGWRAPRRVSKPGSGTADRPGFVNASSRMGLADDVVQKAVTEAFEDVDESALLDAAFERRLRGRDAGGTGRQGPRPSGARTGRPGLLVRRCAAVRS